jgi:hypothetical protein
MAETLTVSGSPESSEGLNADEQESLAIAESLEQGDQPLLAGKFKDPQALEQAYVELQKKLGEPRTEESEPEDGGEPAEEEAEESDADEEVETLSEKQAEMLMEMVGGDKAYKSMLEWAGEAFDQEEIEMYDNVMQSGNPNAIYYAVQALQARYNDSVGSDCQTLTGRDAADSNDSFKSQAEVVAAMSDPRYDRDPAYRRDVMRRLEDSDVEF